ncbi:MAG: PAS domain S-box protein [Anaerolineales bacterium]|nr:PAS domain S-box protein [Anaerolineales bacterium]
MPSPIDLTIFDKTDALVMLLDPEGRILNYNPTFERMTGYHLAEVEGLYIWDLFLSGEAEEQGKSFPDENLRRFRQGHDSQWRNRDGSRRSIIWSNTDLYGPGDSVEKILTIGIDITERKRANGALQEALSRFEAAIEYTPMVAVQGFDRQGYIHHWNPVSAQLYGFNAREAMGRRIQDILISNNDIEQFEITIEKVWKTGQPTEPYEWFVKTSDNKERWVYSTMFPTFENGRVSEIFCMDVDITELKKAEVEIRWQAKMLAALHETALELAAPRTLPNLLRAIQARAMDLLQAQGGRIYIYRSSDNSLELVYQYNEKANLVGTILKQGEGLAGKVIQSREPMMIEDCRECSCWDKCKETGAIACVAVPILWGQNLLGVITLMYDHPRTWQPQEVVLIERFTPLIAAAMENARLLQETHKRAERLELVNRLAGTISTSLYLDDLLNAIFQQLEPLFQPDGFCISFYHVESQELEIKFQVEKGDRKPERRITLRQGGLLAAVVQQNRPLLVQNPKNDPWLSLSDPDQERLLSWLGVPMRVGERVIGCISIQVYRRPAFGDQDLVLLSTIADHVAVAIENANLFEAVKLQTEQVRALGGRLAEAEEVERRRLARELHDQVGQNLTALGINLNIVKSLLSDSATPVILERLTESLNIVEQTAECIRGVLAELRPPLLDDYGLMAALHWYATQISSRTGLEIEVQGIEPAQRLPEQVENALFRIAQEALANAVKYAQATQVTISFREENSKYQMIVVDDGVGFELENIYGLKGWGLLNMNERAETVGGNLVIQTSPKRGAKIVVEIPR